MSAVPGTRTVNIGRTLLVLAMLALAGAWITQLTSQPLLGMSQQRLFNDATVLSLLGIAMFLDAYWHARHPLAEARSRERGN